MRERVMVVVLCVIPSFILSLILPGTALDSTPQPRYEQDKQVIACIMTSGFCLRVLNHSPCTFLTTVARNCISEIIITIAIKSTKGADASVDFS